MKYLNTIRAFGALLLAATFSLGLQTNAIAQTKFRCDYTQEELSNPDAVIEAGLKGEKFCEELVEIKKRLYPKIQLPHFGEWVQVHPEKAIFDLLKRYGVPKHEPFETYGGTYRDYKVIDKKKIDDIEGKEAYEYTVELVYIYLTGWLQVPKSGLDGHVDVCEKNVIKLYAVKTYLGWQMESSGGIGYPFSRTIKSIHETFKRDPKLRKELLALANKSSKLCKLKL